MDRYALSHSPHGTPVSNGPTDQHTTDAIGMSTSYPDSSSIAHTYVLNNNSNNSKMH